MTRRLTKKEIEILGALGIILLPIILIIKFIEAVGWIIFVLILAGIVGGLIWYKKKKRKERIEYLKKKYRNEDIINKILEGYFWQGQTAEQLKDSLGNPADVETKVLKTKKKEIWKYYSDGRNRFRLRLTLENNKVIGWHER